MSDPFAQAAQALATAPARAEKLARNLVARAPQDPRPRLILASALRRQGKCQDALALLVPLAQAYPNAARTRYELGLCLRAIGHGAEGMVQLEAATQLDPSLVEAWQALADASFATGDAARELRANAALARLDADHPDVGRGAELVVLGRCDQAEPILRQFLLKQPNHAQASRLLAACYVAARAFDHAETLLRHAISLKPDDKLARFDLARSLFARQQAEAALAELAPLEAAEPANPAYRNLRAGCLALLGDDAGAEALHASLAQEFPENPRIAVNHGHALRTKGERDAAIAAYRRAIALAPRTGEAWWSLANLKVGTLTAQDGATMRGLLADKSLPDVDRLHLDYALGRACEDGGDAPQAFDHYAKGADLARRHYAMVIPDYAAEAQAVATRFTPEFLAERADWGVANASPIFILGLPRSGSTLVEQILASHPQIEGTMELPYMGAIASRLAAKGPQAVEEASADDIRQWGEEYLARAAVHRRLGRPYFIDKMPNNFRHIGLIRLMLPKARIVDVRRHPMASCFSGFKQLFAEGQEFSYSLEDLGAYYRHYLAIIRHFHEVAPLSVHTLIYEDLVEDTETQVRKLLEAVGVDFHPATLRFFENDRAVRTVSSEQVRQPIYRSGLDHWRAFEPQLAPLAQALGDALENWRD
ncbi:sulfotransferase family protein [Novosphingobium umbonatum]|uniref:Sulfotransferase family protein n=1 Tax=Novosphingobium umbonatum TaxID=1908524 RepID=A0A3S2UVA3_9SPHN|nr:tetratricopeptide repeat-containing sulfotransferase family protein [Novosphingobium umbonatum]RVU05968.1 sulfotransferase family protein [Novosphingobium umbonatum]